MEFEFIKDVLDLDEISGRNNHYAETIRMWLKSDLSESRTLLFKCKNVNERKICYTCVSKFKKKYNCDYCIYTKRGTNNIYLVR